MFGFFHSLFVISSCSPRTCFFRCISKYFKGGVNGAGLSFVPAGGATAQKHDFLCVDVDPTTFPTSMVSSRRFVRFVLFFLVLFFGTCREMASAPWYFLCPRGAQGLGAANFTFTLVKRSNLPGTGEPGGLRKSCSNAVLTASLSFRQLSWERCSLPPASGEI